MGLDSECKQAMNAPLTVSTAAVYFDTSEGIDIKYAVNLRSDLADKI